MSAQISTATLRRRAGIRTATVRERAARGKWIAVVVFAAPLMVLAQTDPRETEAEKPIDFPVPEMAPLELFIGPWSVTESHLDTRGQVIASAKGSEEINWILDYHAIRRVYTSSSGQKAFKAHGTLAWNAAEKKYHGVWFDNVSNTGPSIVKGTWDASTRTMLFEVESAGPSGPLRHRVVEKFESPEKRVATTYQVDGSTLIKRLEVEYHRSKPCPDRLRTFFGG